MPATISFSLSTNNAGTQVKYSNAASRTPAEQFANADGSGDVSFSVSNAVNVMFVITLPDGQFFRLPVLTTTSAIDITDAIAIYPQGVPPGLEDITALIAAQASSGGSIPTYVASLSQTGTDAPTVVRVFYNTLGGIPVWSYNGVGSYVATLAGAFPVNTAPFSLPILNTNAGTIQGIVGTRGTANTYVLQTFDSGDLTTPSDDILNSTVVTIVAYPA